MFAHDFRPGALLIEEGDGGNYRVAWSPPSDASGARLPATPRFPKHCRWQSPMLLACGTQGLSGPLSISIAEPGAVDSGRQVSLIVRWKGAPATTRLMSLNEAVELYGAPADAPLRATWPAIRDYFSLGTLHMLTGWDHLLFVLCLVMLAPFDRRLIGAITAFTLAHSITLSLSVFALVRLPSQPVEVLIALSILLLSSEAARERPSLARRYPFFIAFVMGLLHGLGFAGVLDDLGVPPHHALLSLFSFNVGVEVAQLGFLGALGLAYCVARSLRLDLFRTRGIALYTCGTLSCFWSLERLSKMIL